MDAKRAAMIILVRLPLEPAAMSDALTHPVDIYPVVMTNHRGEFVHAPFAGRTITAAQPATPITNITGISREPCVMSLAHLTFFLILRELRCETWRMVRTCRIGESSLPTSAHTPNTIAGI